MGLPGLDVVLSLATAAVNIVVDGAAAHTIETGDDEACVDALRPGLDAGDDALDAVPASGAIVEFFEPAQPSGVHVWTAPGVQGLAAGFSERCDGGHVSGLLMRHGDRWPRWVPRTRPQQ